MSPPALQNSFLSIVTLNKLKDYVGGYISYALTQKCFSHNSIKAYRRDIEDFLLYVSHRANLLAGDVEEQAEHSREHSRSSLRITCVSFREHLVQTGIGSRSISRKLSALRSFLSYIGDQHRGIFDFEGPELSVGAAPRMLKRLPRLCSDGDLKQLLSAAQLEVDAAKAHLICLLLCTTGMRVSELVALKREDIDLSRGLITIFGKGGKMRKVPLLSKTQQCLKLYLDSRSQKGVSAPIISKRGRISGATLFGICRESVWRLIKRLAKHAGISNSISPHILRHKLATSSLEEGWDLRALQLFLGHERIATTEMYIHLDTRYIKAEYKKRHPRK